MHTAGNEKNQKRDPYMRKALDKIFENKKLSFLIPILIISLVLYLLFIFFGVAEDKLNGIITQTVSGSARSLMAYLSEFQMMPAASCT